MSFRRKLPERIMLLPEHVDELDWALVPKRMGISTWKHCMAKERARSERTQELYNIAWQRAGSIHNGMSMLLSEPDDLPPFMPVVGFTSLE